MKNLLKHLYKALNLALRMVGNQNKDITVWSLHGETDRKEPGDKQSLNWDFLSAHRIGFGNQN